MRHKHAEEIIAWANGAEIQLYQIGMGKWIDTLDPSWLEVTQYRIKPDPRPDVVVQYYANIYSISPVGHFDRIPNLKLTFDIETGELKAAEVLK